MNFDVVIHTEKGVVIHAIASWTTASRGLSKFLVYM